MMSDAIAQTANVVSAMATRVETRRQAGANVRTKRTSGSGTV